MMLCHKVPFMIRVMGFKMIFEIVKLVSLTRKHFWVPLLGGGSLFNSQTFLFVGKGHTLLLITQRSKSRVL